LRHKVTMPRVGIIDETRRNEIQNKGRLTSASPGKCHPAIVGTEVCDNEGSRKG